MIKRLKPFAIAAAIASMTGGAQAATLAGWDFSQWLQSGILSTNGSSLTNTLRANYSNLDPTNNAGAESAQYGTLYFDGQYGSSNVVPEGTGNEIFQPTAGSLVSNLDAPVTGPGTNPFDSLTVLASEGQQYSELLAMGAIAPVQVVFEAALGTAPFTAADWRLTFGGRATGQANVVVGYSTNGVDYASAGSVTLGQADTPYSLALGGLTDARRVFVRLGFQQAAGAGTSIIDNVAILADLQGVVPEPMPLGMLLLGLSGLAAVRVRRD
jgi:hypothetical protein